MKARAGDDVRALAVAMVKEQGMSCRKAARETGVTAMTVLNWCRAESRDG
jgi:transposase